MQSAYKPRGADAHEHLTQGRNRFQLCRCGLHGRTLCCWGWELKCKGLHEVVLCHQGSNPCHQGFRFCIRSPGEATLLLTSFSLARSIRPWHSASIKKVVNHQQPRGVGQQHRLQLTDHGGG